MFKTREKVFISHSSLNKAFVDEDILPQVACAKRDHWYSPKDIGGGHDWRQKLREGMDACSRLLVVVSKEAVASKEVKIEVADATSKLLKTGARLDARRVHRAILPVMIDERDQYGEKPVKRGQPIDLFNMHPYLALVNYIAFPHNEDLNKKLDPETSEYKFNTTTRRYVDPKNQLTKDQLKSITAYAKERNKAKKKLVKAIRNPDALRWNFKRYGRLFVLLTKPSFQRAALATGLAAALFLLLQLPGSLLNRDSKPDEVPHVINIQFEPMLPADGSAIPDQVRAGTRRGPAATTYVSLPSDQSANPQQEVARPRIKIRPIKEDGANEAIAARENVWRVRATSPSGDVTEKFLLIEAELADPQPPQIDVQIDGQTVQLEAGEITIGSDPMDLQIVAKTSGGPQATGHMTLYPPDVGKPVITIQKDGEPVDLDEISMTKDPTALRIVVQNEDGTETAEREITLLPDQTPVEIEFALRSSEGVKRVELAEDYRKAETIPLNDSSLMAVRVKDDPTARPYYAKLQPPDPAEIEIQVDGQPMNLGPATSPHEIPISEQPKLVRVRLKTDTDWGYAKLQPPDPAEIEIQVDGQPMNLGPATSPREIPISEQPKLVRIRLKNEPEWRYAKLQPPDPAEIEIQIDGRPMNLGPATKPAEIFISEKPRLVQVRLKNDSDWGYAKLQPPDPAEIEFRIDGTPMNLGPATRPPEIRVSKEPRLVQVRLKNEPEWSYVKLQPPDPAEVEIQIDGRPINLGPATRLPEIRISEKPVVQVRLKNEPYWRYARLQPPLKPDPPQISVLVSRGETLQTVRSATDHYVDRPQWLLVRQTFDGKTKEVWRGTLRPPQISVERSGDGESWQQTRSDLVHTGPLGLRVVKTVAGRNSEIWTGRFVPPRAAQITVLGSDDGGRSWGPVNSGRTLTVNRQQLNLRVVQSGNDAWQGTFAAPQIGVLGSFDGTNWSQIQRGRHDIDRAKYLRVVQGGNPKDVWGGLFVPRLPQVSVLWSPDGRNWQPIAAGGHTVERTKGLKVVVGGNAKPIWQGWFDPPRRPRDDRFPQPAPAPPVETF